MLLVLAAWALVGLIQASLAKATASSAGPSWSEAVARYLSHAGIWAALTPAIAAWTRRLRPARAGWAKTIAGHAPAWLLVAAIDAAARRALIVATGGTVSVPFAVTITYYADLSLVLYLAVAGLAHATATRRTLHERTLATLALEAEITDARLAQLASQLQPHFLFNTLTAVSELAHESPERAAEVLGRVRTLLAATVRRPPSHTLRLADELALLDAYVELQRLRFGERLEFAADITDRARDALVPALVLQPLVDNAIKHGLAGRPGTGRVRVEATVDGPRLRLAVHDDGPGAPRAAGVGHATGTGLGIGLRNIADRLRHLYGADHRFELVTLAAGGTAAVIDVPLRIARAGSGDP